MVKEGGNARDGQQVDLCIFLHLPLLASVVVLGCTFTVGRLVTKVQGYVEC